VKRFGNPWANLAGGARRVGGVAVLAVRAALRTKTVTALLVLLAVCVAVLPGVVKGDGTPEGELHILLTYTLGFAFGLLCLATLWAACALFSAEIDSARMQLSAVKPVRAAEFWLGKWLALLALNAVALLAAYAGVYAQIRWRMHRDGWAAVEQPVSRHVAHPLLPSPREEALAAYREMRERDALPKGYSERTVLRLLEEKAPERYSEVHPGQEAVWRFRLAKPVRSGEPVTVRIRFETETSARMQVAGVCRLDSLEAGQAVEVPLDDFTMKEIEFSVDALAFGNAAERGLRDFELAFRHTGDAQRASGLILRFRQDVVLLTPGGTFAMNLARAAAVHWSVLALLAAFGLTLSVCFSLPVAAFVATVLLVLTLVGNSVVRVVSEEDAQRWSNKAGILISRGVHEVSRHALQVEPLTALTRGERLDAALMRSTLAWNALLIPLLFAGAGCFVLRRRELADVD
jgi:hypothetical protein